MPCDGGELLRRGDGERAGGDRVAECGEDGGGIPERRTDPALGQSGHLGQQGMGHGPAVLEEENREVIGGGESRRPPAPGPPLGRFPGSRTGGWSVHQVR